MNESALKKVIHNMKVLLGDTQSTSKFLFNGCEFGYKRNLDFTIYGEIIEYLDELNNSLIATSVFDSKMIKNWMAANDLIRLNFIDAQSNFNLNNIKDVGLSIGAVILFPILEETTRKMTQYWDEEGKVIKSIGLEFNLLNEKGKKRTYNTKQQINSIHHKLQILEYTLPDELAIILRSLNKRIAAPLASGMEETGFDLYARIGFQRDCWLHGKELQGIIGIFLSFLLAIYYFGNQ